MLRDGGGRTHTGVCAAGKYCNSFRAELAALRLCLSDVLRKPEIAVPRGAATPAPTPPAMETPAPEMKASLTPEVVQPPQHLPEHLHQPQRGLAGLVQQPQQPQQPPEG